MSEWAILIGYWAIGVVGSFVAGMAVQHRLATRRSTRWEAIATYRTQADGTVECTGVKAKRGLIDLELDRVTEAMRRSKGLT